MPRVFGRSRRQVSEGTPSGAAAPAASRLPSGPLPDAGPARVLLLTRSGCHLCEQAQPIVERACARFAEIPAVVDLDACAPEVRAAWTDHVPVTLVDGRTVAIWFADEPALVAALSDPVAPTAGRPGGSGDDRSVGRPASIADAGTSGMEGVGS